VYVAIRDLVTSMRFHGTILRRYRYRAQLAAAPARARELLKDAKDAVQGADGGAAAGAGSWRQVRSGASARACLH
jgi:hypothetical protein